MAEFDVCVSLGRHCESTYQVRRITGTSAPTSSTDCSAVAGALDGDFAGVLQPGSLIPDDEGRCAWDRQSGIRFYHDFLASDPRSGLTEADIAAQFPRVREKFHHLADRWRELAESPRRVLFVHHDALAEADAALAAVARLHAVLGRSRPPDRFRLLWLRPSPPADAAALPDGVAWSAISPLPGRWQGDDTQWDALFATLARSRA
jgi:hypothetical protein